MDSLSPFSFDRFEAKFFESSFKTLDLSANHWFNNYIQALEAEGREGTRISYNTTLNSLISFKLNLKLTDVSKKFLTEYEAYMKKTGMSPSTIGIYLRNLRAIINQAIAKGVLRRDDYPFKDFEIPGSRNINKALDDKNIQLLLEYKPSIASHQKAIDFWILSYLCNGMNFTDLLHLLPENYSGNFIYFIRQKTIRTRKKDLRPIKVPLVNRAKEIIEHWKNLDLANPYLFPILETGLSAKTIKHRTQRFINMSTIAWMKSERN